MPKIFELRGPLASAVNSYVALLKATGRKARNTWSALSLLDRWLQQQGVRRATDVTPEVLARWKQEQDGRLHPFTVDLRVGQLRRFFLYLYSRGVIDRNPAELLTTGPRPFYLPFVFTLEEIRLLLTHGVAALKLRERRTAYTLFHLLYATGMRRSEALGLRLADVNLGERLIHIRCTKFYKERWVPFGRRVVRNLRSYLADRQRRDGPLPQDAFVFASTGNVPIRRAHGPMDGAVAWHLFDRMLRAVNLKSDGDRKPHQHGPPRIHALRHSFCVHRLIKWYREGADLTHKLFLLSAYVGHRGPAETVVYLRATDALLSEAKGRFDQFLSGLRE